MAMRKSIFFYRLDAVSPLKNVFQIHLLHTASKSVQSKGLRSFLIESTPSLKQKINTFGSCSFYFFSFTVLDNKIDGLGTSFCWQ